GLFTRRNFLRQCGATLCFVIPLFRGRLGQPVLAPAPWFIDTARAAGLAAFRDRCGSLAKQYLVETLGSGVALFDYNQDGLVDVLLGNGTFTNVTHEAGVEGGNWSTGCAWGDYDRDGRLDLYVSRYVDFDKLRTPRPGANTYCRYQGVPVACGPRGLPGLPDLLYHNEGN